MMRGIWRRICVSALYQSQTSSSSLLSLSRPFLTYTVGAVWTTCVSRSPYRLHLQIPVDEMAYECISDMM